MNKDLLNKAISKLSIMDVALYESNIELLNDFDPIYPNCDSMTVQFRHGYDRAVMSEVTSEDTESQTILRAYFKCAFRILPSDLDKETMETDNELRDKILALVETTFCAYYSVSEKIEDEAIDEFCRCNVGYHVWPYWREYASSIATRLRLPPVTPPLYQIPQDG